MKPKEHGREYLPIEPDKGYPAGGDLFYECLVCGDVIPSIPDDDTRCKCRNLTVDVGFSRMVIDDPTKARLFRVIKE